jgi:hypothetical protein
VAEAIQPLREEALSYRVSLECAAGLDPAPHAPIVKGKPDLYGCLSSRASLSTSLSPVAPMSEAIEDPTPVL